MTILGVDYGEKKIGLSLSEGKFAAPVGIEPNNKDFERKIKALCQKEKVGKIVVGLSSGKILQKQKDFGLWLSKICRLPVEFWDESLTSNQALQQMILSGVSQKRRRLEDAVAATIILQSYLESINE